MQFLVALAGIIAGTLIAAYAYPLIQITPPNVGSGKASARVYGVISSVDSSTITMVTSKGVNVKVAYSPATSWQSIDYKTVGSTTVRAILREADAGSFTMGSKIRAYTYRENDDLLLGRAIKIIND